MPKQNKTKPRAVRKIKYTSNLETHIPSYKGLISLTN